ncbi:LysR family transcriptional regulator [Actinoplanes sp. CA-142083]|uniref:LysR family transcriptional regulator n=1 Tax=Actinoplanes sp. CA-142083 TaxID=3239903 RepID=UPI003D8E3AEA
MDTQLLAIFRTVAHLGSITAAARRLRYTQSAVSRQIGALEAELGSRVFDRLPRGVTLTEEGRALLPYASQVLDGLDSARRAVEEVRSLGSGRLRVGAFPTAVAALVPAALASFREAYPEVGLTLVEGLTPGLLERLAAGEADVAVVSSSPAGPLDRARFELRHLLDERMLVAVARGHRLARRRTVRLDELAGDAFIAGSASAEETLLRASLPSGFRPRIEITAAEWTGKLGCVAAGLGVALIPALAAGRVPPGIAVLRLHPDDESVRHIYAATPPGRRLSPAVTRFLEHLTTAAMPFSRGAGSSSRSR